MTKDANAQDSGYQAFSSQVAFFEDKHFERKNKIKKKFNAMILCLGLKNCSVSFYM